MEIAGAAAGLRQTASIERTCNRDDRLREVFDRVGEGLYRFILMRVGGDRHTADDLLQQTCYEAARHRRPPTDNGECAAWMWGIARNLLRRHWRDQKRQAGLIPLDSAAAQLADCLEARPLPQDALIREEMADALLLAVTELAAEDQRLVFGYYFDGRRQAEIARDEGITEKSVETRLARARQRLRNTLRSMGRSGGR